MAVSTTVPLPPSAPDVAKLNTFTGGGIVTVTKHQQARNTVGQQVVNTTRMAVQQILDLQATIPLQHGPGFYKFSVTDPGGTGDCEWLVRLGPEMPEVSMAGPLGLVPPSAPGANVPTGPVSEGVRALGHGFFYDESQGLLTTPWRAIVSWRPGEALPVAPPLQSSGQPQQSPWPQSSWAGPGGWGAAGAAGWPAWGTMPATDDSTKLALEAANKRVEDQERRFEQDRRDREQRDREERRAEQERADRAATNDRFEKLFQLITAKPAGPSEHEQRMERELAETRRRQEESEREAKRERDAREAEDRRREEMRLADERHREEMRLVREEIKAAGANRTDPMMTLFSSILTSQATSSAETARMIRETSALATAAAERSSTQIVDIVRSQRDGVAEASRIAVESMKDTLGTQREVLMSAIEMQRGGDQPWFADIVREGVGQVSAVGQAIVSARAQQQQQVQQPQYVPPRTRAQPQQARAQVAQTVAATTPIPQVGKTPPGEQVDTGGRPPGVQFDNETEEFILANGARVPQLLVQQVGWTKALQKMNQHAVDIAATNAAVAAANATVQPPAPVPPVAQPIPTVGPMNGAGHDVPIAHEAPPPVARGRKKGTGKRKKRTRVEETPPAQEGSYTLEQLRDLDPEELGAFMAQVDDQHFFGILLNQIAQLRTAAAGGTPAAEIAGYVLQARPRFAQMPKPVPIAVELLIVEQIEVLVDRLVPQMPDDYRNEMVETMRATLDQENGRVTDDGDDEDDEDDGAEADA